MGFPGGSVGKKSICNAGESGSPGEGNGNPFQYSCLKNPMDRVAWWTTVREIAKSLTPLSTKVCWKPLDLILLQQLKTLWCLLYCLFFTNGWQMIYTMCRLWFGNCWLSTPSSMKKDRSPACSETGQNRGVTGWEPGVWSFKLPASLTWSLTLEPDYTEPCTIHTCLNVKYWYKIDNQQGPSE